MKWQDILSAVGAFGLAVTVFSNLQSLLQFSDWVHFGVEQWHVWTHAFWSYLFGWLGLNISPFAASLLTMITFAISLSVGANFQHSDSLFDEGIKVGNALPRKLVYILAPVVLLILLGISCVVMGLTTSPVLIFAIFIAGILCIFAIVPNIPGERLLGSVANITLIMIMISGVPLKTTTFESLLFLISLSFAGLLLSFGNSTRQRRRIFQVLVVLACIFAANEVSKLGIKIDAPPKLT